MPLSSGTRLGPYEIQGSAGSGGMGEVYKARDTRLDRTVAIKVLPRTLASDPQFRQRFDREARTISALDHPHICTVFDVGEVDGEAYLVMQFLEGETLADRLRRGRLPIDEAITIATQIATALEEAHRRTIVHRDLKPANVMLTRTGSGRTAATHARLLDFGLAKPGGPVALQSPASMAATQEASITAQGTLLGTLQYMSPEQVDGREADARSDIFALGCVLNEMLTGKPPFTGRSAASLIAAIMEHEPPGIAQDQPVAPAGLDHIVRRCLAKDPDDRWPTARDVRLELQWLVDRQNAADGQSMVAPRKSRERLGWGLAGLLLISLAVGSLWLYSGSAPPVAPKRLSIVLAHSQINYGGLPPTLAISPDGKLVAHLTWNEGVAGTLYLRPLDSFESTALAGTDGAWTPFFSPDSQWLGFVANAGTRLRKISVSGGAVVALADLPAAAIGAPVWLADGSIVTAAGGALYAVPAHGGSPVRLTPESAVSDYGDTTRVDGHTALLVTERPKNATWDDARIIAFDRSTGYLHTVIDRAYSPRYMPSGHLLFARDGQLFAVRLDSELRAIGAPVAALPGVTVSSTFGYAQLSVASDGTIVYLPPALAADRELVWIDRSGTMQPALPIVRPFEHPRLSPAGDRVAIGMRPGTHIWIGEFTRGTLERLTFSPQEEESPVWHPDGVRVAFAATRGVARHTLLKNADGTGDEVLLFDHGAGPHHHLGAWSTDGTVLTFTDTGGQGAFDLYTLASSPKTAVSVFLRTGFNEQATTLSPDGQWVAYASDETGRFEVYVRPLTRPGGKRQVSTSGGTEPLWSRDGRELFFRNGNRMMVVEVAARETVAAGVQRQLFEGSFERMPWGERNYDVSPDGKRFLMLRAVGRPPTELRVVLNWDQELKRLVP